MVTMSSFKSIENKHGVYRGKDSMKKFSKSLREHTVEIIFLFLKKKRKELLTNQQQKSYKKCNFFIFVKKKVEDKHVKYEKYCKAWDHFHYAGEYRGVPKGIPIDFQNGSIYYYLFIIKKLAEESKKQFTCLGEYSEKYLTFSVPIQKEVTRTDKDGEEITKTIFYRLQFIDSARFMASSLSGVSFRILLKEFMKLNANMNTMI